MTEAVPSPLKDATVLVTGMTGFIGQHLAGALAASGARVYGLSQRGARDLIELHPPHRALHWEDTNEWWGGPEMQFARKKSCERCARTERQLARTVRRLITTHTNQASSR